MVQAVAECARRYIEREDVLFCCYDHGKDKYLLVTSQEVLTHIEAMYSSKSGKLTLYTDTENNIFYTILYKVLPLIPSFVVVKKNRIYLILRRFFKKNYVICRKITKKILIFISSFKSLILMYSDLNLPGGMK